MVTVSKQIERILNYKTYTPKRKEDALLEMDCHLYTNLGTDSAKEEREQAKKNSIEILTAIQKVNWELGGSLLYAMDR